MNKKYHHAELARTQAVGAKTVVMDRPPEMTMVPGRNSQRLTVVPGAYRNRPSATPSVMTTTVLKTNKKPRPLPSPPRPSATSLLAKTAAPSTRAVQPPPIPTAGARPKPAPASAPRTVPARTRMVDLREALAKQGALPPLPSTFAPPPPHYAPGPAAPALLSMPRSTNRMRRVLQERRSLLVVAAVALLLLLLLPQLIGEGEAEALKEQAAARGDAPAAVAATEPLQPTPAATPDPLPEPTPAATPEPAQAAAIADATPEPAPNGPLSEAQAGALLLSGRRGEALATYRALAQQPGAHAGIEAMVIVLEQKVNPL